MENFQPDNSPKKEEAREQLAEKFDLKKDASEKEILDALLSEHPELIDSDPLFEKSESGEVDEFLMYFEKRIERWEKMIAGFDKLSLKSVLTTADFLQKEVKNAISVYKKAWKSFKKERSRVDLEKFEILVHRAEISKTYLTDLLH